MSNFTFLNLTERTRQLMLKEMNADIENGSFYLSPRLNSKGAEAYPTILSNSISSGDASTFQQELENGNFFHSTELRQGKPVKMPSNAVQLLAQSEFNRYYIRALCLKAISRELETVEIYRARESSWKRPESELKIGTRINASDLLEDLRKNIGKEPTLLPEVNSGLSVRI